MFPMMVCENLSILFIIHNWSSEPGRSHIGDYGLDFLIGSSERWVQKWAKIEPIVVRRVFIAVLASVLYV